MISFTCDYCEGAHPRILEALREKVLFEVWETLPDGRLVTRFATSWATTEEQVALLEECLKGV